MQKFINKHKNLSDKNNPKETNYFSYKIVFENFQFLIFNRQNSKGFTLLEVLLSISILSIILVAIYSTLFLSEKSISATDEYGLRLEEGRRFHDLLSSEMKSIVYNEKDLSTHFLIRDRENYGKPASEAIFITIGGPDDGVYRMEYFTREKDKSTSIYKKIVRLYQEDEPMEIKVMEDIYSFKIRIKDEGKWSGSWDTKITGRLPDEIEITLGVKIKDQILQLSRSIRPMIEAE